MNDFCIAHFRNEQKEEAYRIYVTDSLKIVAENTSHISGGKYIKLRYADLIADKPVERRSAKEVIDHVCSELSKMGGG